MYGMYACTRCSLHYLKLYRKNITHLGLFLFPTVPRDCPNLKREFCHPLTITQVVDIKLVLQSQTQPLSKTTQSH